MPQKNPRGTFKQIAEALRAEIASVPPLVGETATRRLGTEAELSERFGVARNTLRKALAELADERLVYSEPTRGWFIGRPPAAPTTQSQSAIVAELSAKIAGGAFEPNAKFTTAPTIAATYGVSRHVARQALLTLSAKGLIESRHGKGWYVRDAAQ